MITILYDTPVNLQNYNLPDILNFFPCVFVKTILDSPKGGGHNIFKAAKLPTNWLKIAKSVIVTVVTDFPLSSF